MKRRSALEHSLLTLGLDDSAKVHRWLCHPERPCVDGCADPALPDRLKVYERVVFEAQVRERGEP